LIASQVVQEHARGDEELYEGDELSEGSLAQTQQLAPNAFEGEPHMQPGPTAGLWYQDLPADYSFGLPKGLRQVEAKSVFLTLSQPRHDAIPAAFLDNMRSGRLDFDHHLWDTAEHVIWIPLDQFNQLQSFRHKHRAPMLPDLARPQSVEKALFSEDTHAMKWAKQLHDKCRKGTAVIELDADISMLKETYHPPGLPFRNMAELYHMLNAHLHIPGFVTVANMAR
jgi:hypothetical protein